MRSVPLLVVLLMESCSTQHDSNGPLFENRGIRSTTDSTYAVAYAYAPWIYHATERDGGRQDIISNIDFDGDFIGNNNWENFERFKLRPTVYYAVLETETHYFISYHLFHPRDWNHFSFWLNDTHENDGENLQVVVRKKDGRVVLLWTQAHYESKVHTMDWSNITSGRTTISGGYQLADSSGLLDDQASHVCIFVESEGHGIYGTLDSESGVKLHQDGSYFFKEGSGLLFRPARPGERAEEPAQFTSGLSEYELQSTVSVLWPLFLSGKLIGDGKLLDGSSVYEDDLVGSIEVPRYYDADRFSGPLGSDRGISPFALDFSFDKGTIGSLFFNPAQRYAGELRITAEWSLRYLGYPLRGNKK